MIIHKCLLSLTKIVSAHPELSSDVRFHEDMNVSQRPERLAGHGEGLGTLERGSSAPRFTRLEQPASDAARVLRGAGVNLSFRLIAFGEL